MGGADEPRLGRGLGGERAVLVFESVVSAGRDGGGGGVLRDQRLGDHVTRVESHALEADHGRARLDPAEVAAFDHGGRVASELAGDDRLLLERRVGGQFHGKPPLARAEHGRGDHAVGRRFRLGRSMAPGDADRGVVGVDDRDLRDLAVGRGPGREAAAEADDLAGLEFCGIDRAADSHVGGKCEQPAVGQWHALLVGLLHADLVPPALVIADRQPPTGYGLDGAGEREPLCDGELG